MRKTTIKSKETKITGRKNMMKYYKSKLRGMKLNFFQNTIESKYFLLIRERLK